MPIYHSVKIEEGVWKSLQEFQMKRESLSEAIARLLKLYLAVSAWAQETIRNPEYQAWKEKKEVTEK